AVRWKTRAALERVTFHGGRQSGALGAAGASRAFGRADLPGYVFFGASAPGASRGRHRRSGAASPLRKECADLFVAGRGGEALPVHQAGLGRIFGRARRCGSRSRGSGAGMSVLPAKEPKCSEASPEQVVAAVIDARARDLGGFAVRRVLPSAVRRMVGPFTFFDEMGPAIFAPAQGLDVRPHPHIGLATVTYLFEGEIMHRDSLGSAQPIRPGDINWMTAGRGIVHSERTSPAQRQVGSRL